MSKYEACLKVFIKNTFKKKKVPPPKPQTDIGTQLY